jgi:hypothetical protein
MLRLNLIVHNPVGDSVITWIGVIILAVLAAMVAALWVAIARRTVRPDDGASDPGLEGLRRRRLVVLPSRKSRDPEAVVVSELDPSTSESEPTAR